MFYNYHHQIARIRQAEFLQEAKADQQLERRIRHFFTRIGLWQHNGIRNGTHNGARNSIGNEARNGAEKM